MSDIHLSLQGKGGVGKTTQMVLFTQYLIYHKGTAPENVICIDTDQENASFASFKEFKATKMNIRKGLIFDPRGWDGLTQQCLIGKPEQIFLIDNGASSYSSISGYLVQNRTFDLWSRRKHRIFVHVPFAGGEGLGHAIEGWRWMIENFPPSIHFILWLHKFLGPLELLNKDFFQIPEVVELAEKLDGRITLIDLREYDTMFTPDITYMLSHNLTFKDLGIHKFDLADTETDFPTNKHGITIPSLMRLVIFRDDVFSELEMRGM